MARSNHKMQEIAETVGARDKVLLAALDGWHLKHKVLHSQVLVAIYIPSNRTKSGIFFTDKTVEEDRWQGTVGLVIGLGKGAFKDDSVAQFNGDKLKIGEWVLFNPADGLAMYINQVPCRLFQDSRILISKITNPEVYY
jgi:co-chaperonin GroES (HSP10)